MRSFTFNELKIIGIVLVVIFTLSYFNLQISLRRARDFQRKEDVKNIADAVNVYKEENRTFPANDAEGKIVACKDEKGKSLRSCEWGWDGLGELERVPGDPRHSDGFRYLYKSSGKDFQILASLEGRDEAEFEPRVEVYNLNCGNQICNFGRGSIDPALDIVR